MGVSRMMGMIIPENRYDTAFSATPLPPNLYGAKGLQQIANFCGVTATLIGNAIVQCQDRQVQQ